MTRHTRTDASASRPGVTRRRTLQLGAAAFGTTLAPTLDTTTARAQKERPDFDGYLDDVENFDGTVVDARGDETVTIANGAEGNGDAFAFDPPAIHVDAGTTVVWEWTGEGGQHNVVHRDGVFESDLADEDGHTFEHTFEETGVYLYYCQPHEGLGMKGAVVVGDDYPTTTAEPGGSGDGAGGGDGSGDGEADDDGGEASSDSGGVTGLSGPEHQFIVLLISLLGLTGIIALAPEIAAAPATVRRAVSGVGSRLHAVNNFRDRLVTSTVLGWATFLFVLLLGTVLVVVLWTVSTAPSVFVGFWSVSGGGLPFLVVLVLAALIVGAYVADSVR